MIARPSISQTRIPRWDQMTQYVHFTLRPTDLSMMPSLRNPQFTWEVWGGVLHGFCLPGAYGVWGNSERIRKHVLGTQFRCLELGKFMGRSLNNLEDSRNKVRFLFQEGLLASDEQALHA